jgi:hypothetical protein
MGNKPDLAAMGVALVYHNLSDGVLVPHQSDLELLVTGSRTWLRPPVSVLLRMQERDLKASL